MISDLVTSATPRSAFSQKSNAEANAVRRFDQCVQRFEAVVPDIQAYRQIRRCGRATAGIHTRGKRIDPRRRSAMNRRSEA